MFINEASRITHLTKKAIEYYAEQGLISPAILANGYRDFRQSDVECLKKISVFRKLGLCTQDIKAILADEAGDKLQKISVQKELNVRREQAKKAVLDKLCRGRNYSEINADLEAIEQSSTVTEKLLEAFPGYYGRFICLHFARFLNEPIATDGQHQAYEEIMAFLDGVPTLDIPEDLQAFLDESTRSFESETIGRMLEDTKQSIENTERFMSENKESLERYLEFRRSDEYKKSPLNKMRSLLKAFNSSSGYYDIFIPAMKRLSKSYAEYCRQMELANEKLIRQYPEISQFNDVPD